MTFPAKYAYLFSRKNRCLLPKTRHEIFIARHEIFINRHAFPKTRCLLPKADCSCIKMRFVHVYAGRHFRKCLITVMRHLCNTKAH